jgi:hypothetical protein
MALRNLGERSGWELAESEGRIEAEDVLERLVRIALHEFGENQDKWPMSFDDEGFLESLTAEGIHLKSGISIHVWPNDHPPPHVHVLRKSEPDSNDLKIDLATGEPDGELPDWVHRKQLRNIKALVVEHHEKLAAWWLKHHGEVVQLLD